MKISTNRIAFCGNINYYNNCDELKPLEKQIQDIIDQKQVDLYIARGVSGYGDNTDNYLFRATKHPEKLDKTHGVKILTKYKHTKDTVFCSEVLDTVNKVSDIAIERAGGMTVGEKITQYFRKALSLLR